MPKKPLKLTLDEISLASDDITTSISQVAAFINLTYTCHLIISLTFFGLKT